MERTQKVGEGVRSAYGVAVGAAMADGDALRAYERVGELRDVLAELVGDAALKRAAMAYRLQVDRSLSVAQVAECLGVSKARAGQLVVLGREHANSLEEQRDSQQMT